MYNLGNQFVFDNKRANMNSACVLKGANYRISILTPDEQVSSIIPEQDITIDGINYTEEY